MEGAGFLGWASKLVVTLNRGAPSAETPRWWAPVLSAQAQAQAGACRWGMKSGPRSSRGSQQTAGGVRR